MVAIPDKWKSEVKKKNVCLNEKKSCTIFNVKSNLKHIGILQTKEIYKMLYTHPEEPFCIKYWEKQNLIVNYDWVSTFSFKIKNRITNKIGNFQYNLMYNLVCCKKNLHKWKLSDSDKCNICNCIDDYDHFFVKCKYNKTFWTRFSKYIQEFKKDYNFRLSLEKIIYGWNIDNSNSTFVNILIELASFLCINLV